MILWLGRRMKWQPTPVFLPGECHGQRNRVGYSPGGHKELDMAEWLTLLLGRKFISHILSLKICRYFSMNGWNVSRSYFGISPILRFSALVFFVWMFKSFVFTSFFSNLCLVLFSKLWNALQWLLWAFQSTEHISKISYNFLHISVKLLVWH